MGHVENTAIVTFAAEEELGPGDAVPFAKFLATEVTVDPRADGVDDADDFMAQDRRAVVMPLAFPGVNIGTANGGHGNLD